MAKVLLGATRRHLHFWEPPGRQRQAAKEHLRRALEVGATALIATSTPNAYWDLVLAFEGDAKAFSVSGQALVSRPKRSRLAEPKTSWEPAGTLARLRLMAAGLPERLLLCDVSGDDDANTASLLAQAASAWARQRVQQGIERPLILLVDVPPYYFDLAGLLSSIEPTLFLWQVHADTGHFLEKGASEV